jgi:outer membrane protein OmpA-like peptidoglycan-associated protein
MFKYLALFSLASLLLLNSCATTVGFSKKRGFDVEKGPIYKGNKLNGKEGNRKVTQFNYNKSEREKAYIANLELIELAKNSLEDFRIKFNQFDNSQKIESVDSLLISINQELEDLIKEFENLNLYTAEGYKMGLLIGVKINDLKTKKIIPVGMMIKSMTINTVKADTDFSTGSSKLSKNGIKTIQKVVDNIITELDNWNIYLKDHNENVFNQEKFVVKILVNGYADMQGATDYNQKLSEDRAYNVYLELNRLLKEISSKYNLNINIVPKGYGETVPPGVTPNGKNDDPARRITTIICVTGPSLLIK